MRYTEYGTTGKKVSVVGFGGMRFDMDKSDEENAELVRYALSKGINYLDTAPGYGGGRSENTFKIALKDMPGEWYVTDKAMPTSHETAEKGYTAVCTALEKLGLDKIHFYHVWCLRTYAHYELAMKKGGQYEGLLKAREEGLIEHIVCSTHMPGHDVARMLKDGHFEGCLMGLNILNFPYRWEGVEAATELNLGVVAMNPLGGGAIPKYSKDLAFLSEGGATPVEAALRFNIANPQIDVSLVGFTTTAHIDQAVACADTAEPMTKAQLDAIRARISENMNTACTGCGYCKDCPQDLPVPNYMQFYNPHVMFNRSSEEMVGMLDDAYNWQLLVDRKASAADCVECGACEEACTQHLPIMERMKEIAKWEETYNKNKTGGSN